MKELPVKMDIKEEAKRIEVLKHIYNIQINELMFRRRREFRIFIWSGSLFFSLMGVILIFKESETLIWNVYGIPGKVTASLAVVVLSLFSIIWQNRERRFGNDNAKIINKINKLFGCFDKGALGFGEEESLYPSEWRTWGYANLKKTNRYFRANLVTSTWILSVLCVAMIWMT